VAWGGPLVVHPKTAAPTLETIPLHARPGAGALFSGRLGLTWGQAIAPPLPPGIALLSPTPSAGPLRFWPLTR